MIQLNLFAEHDIIYPLRLIPSCLHKNYNDLNFRLWEAYFLLVSQKLGYNYDQNEFNEDKQLTI